MADIGCGSGRHSFEALKRRCDVIALDLEDAALKDVAGMVRVLKAEGSVSEGTRFLAVNGDALELPFRDRALDRVVASEVLEHIADDEAAIAEIARVLRDGGRAVVTVPRFWPEMVCWMLSRDYHARRGGHVRIYRARELADKLARAGLEPLAKHHAHGLHPPYWWLRCIFGIDRPDALLPQLYHRFLLWDLARKPRVTRLLERVLNPLMGKSLVVYAEKRPRR